MHIIRWLAIPVLVAVGAGAVWASTGASIGAATTTGTLLTSAAEVATVSEEVAATGNVQPAVQYALTFGADPSVVGSAAAGAKPRRSVFSLIVTGIRNCKR